jgi:hypothetical protein
MMLMGKFWGLELRSILVASGGQIERFVRRAAPVPKMGTETVSNRPEAHIHPRDSEHWIFIWYKILK